VAIRLLLQFFFQPPPGPFPAFGQNFQFDVSQ
jgi:hypothetical protein